MLLFASRRGCEEMNFIISLILGMLPEVLFFTLFLIFTNDLKTKRLKLFGLLVLGYISLIMILRYEFLFYIGYVIYAYLILKLLYKVHISDLFVFALSFSYVALLSYFIYKFMSDNYYLAFAIDRILLFVPFIFKKYLRLAYLKYLSLWNRNDKEERKIKSITLRNISLIFINLLIVLLYVFLFLCMIDTSKYM
jgi:hypothetical protein